MNEESIDNNITFMHKWSSCTFKIKDEFVSPNFNFDNTLSEDVKSKNYFTQDFQGLPKENFKSEEKHFPVNNHLNCSENSTVDPVSNPFWLFSENFMSSKQSLESQHATKIRTQSPTIKFPFGDIKNIDMKNESIFNNNNNNVNNNGNNSFHNSNYSSTICHFQNECKTEKNSNCSHILSMDNINLQEMQSPQLASEKFHIKDPGEKTKSSYMSFPMQPTNENFYKHTFMRNSIENLEKDNTKQCLSSHQRDDSSLTIIKHVNEEYFPDNIIEIDTSKTFYKHQLISGAEFTNLKRKSSNPIQIFLHAESSKMSSDFIKDNQNSSKITSVSFSPFEIKESEKYSIQPLFNDVLTKTYSPCRNLYIHNGTGSCNTMERPYQQTNYVDSLSSHKPIQQQGTVNFCHQDTKESFRKSPNENLKDLTEEKKEEILNNSLNIPIDENEELNNLELQNLITKLTEYLPRNDSIHKPTLEDVVIAAANYALELNMLVQNNNDTTPYMNQTESSQKRANNIKRPQNGFIRYSVEKRAEVAAKNPHLDNRNISCVLGSQWKLLSKENREHYQQKFEAEMKDLRKKHPDWMYSNKKNDVDVILEVMPTRLRPADKRKKKVLDIFDEVPMKKKIMSKKRTSKRIPRCKENIKTSKCQKCKIKLKNNNKRIKSKEQKQSREKDFNGNNNDDDGGFEDKLIIDESVSSLNTTALALEFSFNSNSDVILQENKTYLPPEMSWELQMNTEYPLLDSLFQPSVDSCNQIAFN